MKVLCNLAQICALQIPTSRVKELECQNKRNQKLLVSFIGFVVG
jgi:hypothetical protein